MRLDPSPWQVKAIVIVGLGAIILTFLGGLVVFYLETPCYGCGMSFPRITKVAFGSNPGEVTFTVNNPVGSDVPNVRIVKVVEGSLIPGNVTASTNVTVPTGSTISFTVTLLNITFQHGVSYGFTLIDSRGSKYPTSETA